MLNPQQCPEPIQKIREIMQAEIDALKIIEQIETESMRRWAGYSSVLPMRFLPNDAEISTIRRAATATIEAAREALRIGDIAPEIDEWELVQDILGSPDEFRRASGFADDHHIQYWRRFDPVKTWEHIQSIFPPEKIKKQAAVRSAKAIKSAFCLYCNKAPSTSGGRALFDIPAHSRECSGGTERYYYSQDVRNSLMDDVETFISLTNQPQNMATCFRQVTAALVEAFRYNFRFNSRDKQVFTEGAQITFFKSCVKVHLPIALAQDLLLYLAEHGKGY